jgi:L-amino acid N-acyltransferase
MIQIRTATEADLPGILAIYNEVILNTTAVYNYQAHTLEMRAAWLAEKKQQGMPVFVAEENGRILGFSAIGPFRAWAAYKYTVENSIYVDAAQRGRGLGKLLLEPLISSARQLGLHTIVAGIDATNEQSIGLHKKYGFTEVARFREVGYKFGRWLDLVFLQLVLDTPAAPNEL